MRRTKGRSRGFTLIASLLVLTLLSAIAVGLLFMVYGAGQVGGNDLETNQAYYGAESGMELLTANLAALYQQSQAPTPAQLTNLTNSPPTSTMIGAMNYQESVIWVPDANGNPKSSTSVISSGPNAGLTAEIIPLTLKVNATRTGGASVNMTRDVEVAQIPVFQFGVFSDSDLSYFAGPNFDFGGRVHTNGDLYLAEGNGSTLTFHDKLTAHGEVIRQTLVNGLTTSGNYTGTVNVPTAPNGCATPTSSCRTLAVTEGSLIGGKNSSPTPGRDTFTQSTYFGNLVHHAAQLNLPFVDDGAPIEIIREPLPAEDPA